MSDTKAQDNRGIHGAVATALGQAPRFHHATLIPQVEAALAAEADERNRQVILAIDESHLLTGEQLEAVRMLTSHDLDSGSPLTVLLIGQPTLKRRLRVGDMAALDGRIQLRYHIPAPALTAAEASGYLRAHLTMAGRSDILFSDDAVRAIQPTPAACPAPSTGSRSPRSWQHAQPARPSPTNPPPAPPSPKRPPPRQTDHDRDTSSTPSPARPPPGGAFHTPRRHTERRQPPHGHPGRRGTHDQLLAQSAVDRLTSTCHGSSSKATPTASASAPAAPRLDRSRRTPQNDTASARWSLGRGNTLVPWSWQMTGTVSFHRTPGPADNSAHLPAATS